MISTADKPLLLLINSNAWCDNSLIQVDNRLNNQPALIQAPSQPHHVNQHFILPKQQQAQPINFTLTQTAPQQQLMHIKDLVAHWPIWQHPLISLCPSIIIKEEGTEEILYKQEVNSEGGELLQEAARALSELHQTLEQQNKGDVINNITHVQPQLIVPVEDADSMKTRVTVTTTTKRTLANTNAPTLRPLKFHPFYTMDSRHFGLRQTVAGVDSNELTQNDNQPAHRTRVRLNSTQTSKLCALFSLTAHPSDQQKSSIARELGIDKRVVQTWFQNRRQLVKRLSPPASSSGPTSPSKKTYTKEK